MSSQLRELLFSFNDPANWNVDSFYRSLDESPASLSAQLEGESDLPINTCRALYALVGKLSPEQGILLLLNTLTSSKAKYGLLRRIGVAISNVKQPVDDNNILAWRNVLSSAGLLTPESVSNTDFLDGIATHPLLVNALLSTSSLTSKDERATSLLTTEVREALADMLCQRMHSKFHVFVLESVKSVVIHLNATSVSRILSRYLNSLKRTHGEASVIVESCERQSGNLKKSLSVAVRHLQSNRPQYPEASLYNVIRILALPWRDIEKHLAQSGDKNAAESLRNYLSLMGMTPMDFLHSREMSAETYRHALRLFS